jgi:flagellar assembly protein FliH
MSCKVLEPDEPKEAVPVPWKRIGQQKGAGAPACSPAEPQPELDQLRQEWEQRVRDARAAGFREGETAGRERAAAEFQAIVERFSETIGEFGQLRARLRREAEADTLKLALAIARRVLRRELAVDANALEALLLGALEKLRAQEISRVRIHPSLAGTVTACLQKTYPGVAVEIIPDGSRAPGTVIFETARGNLDASIDAQLQEIERGLVDRLANHR